MSTTASKLAPAQRVEVAVAVAAQLLDVGEELGPRLAAVEQRHVVAARERGVDRVAAEELRAAENEDPHTLEPMWPRSGTPSLRDYARVIAVIDEWWGGRAMAAMLPKLFFVHFRDTSFVAEDDGRARRRSSAASARRRTTTRRTSTSSASTRRIAGSGLGRELYERFFAAVAPRTIVRAVTAPVNERSVAFHQALGFEVERVDEDYDGRGEARVLLDQTPLTSDAVLPAELTIDAPVGAPVYRGKFDAPQAERLLWRAGFGPRPGEAEALAKLGLDGAVHSLLNPGAEKLVGPKPHDSKGRPLAPADAWGHDHCWWLDRMVRTSRPLVERMTLVWHDWFATSNAGVGDQGLMLAAERPVPQARRSARSSSCCST